MSTAENEKNDAWHMGQVRRLGAPLSAWYALECGCRAAKFVDREFARETLGDVQEFLLGRSTWFEIEAARERVEAQVWSTPRSETLKRRSLAAIRAATHPDSEVQHFYAAQFARRLDDRSAKPLSSGIREETLQQQRLEVFAMYAECGPIQQLAQVYRTSHDLAVLGMFADALQDEGYTPPFRSAVS